MYPPYRPTFTTLMHHGIDKERNDIYYIPDIEYILQKYIAREIKVAIHCVHMCVCVYVQTCEEQEKTKESKLRSVT